jgi:peptide/nickel transport system permease protein
MRTALRGIERDPRIWVAGSVVALVLLAAAVGPALAPFGANEMSPQATLRGPGGEHLLGTDEFGRDIFSRLLHGARLSMVISVGAVLIAGTFGTLLGMLAGYYSGRVETAIMRAVDFILSFPNILLALFVVVFVGTELHNVILVIGVLYIPNFARVLHGVVLSVRRTEYVEAARAIGAPDWRILLRSILPNVMAPVLVQASLVMGNAILLEASLSFLGLGPPPPATAWGRMIEESASFMRLNPWVLIWPAIVISASVLAFNLLGDVLRDRMDPRLRRG